MICPYCEEPYEGELKDHEMVCWELLDRADYAEMEEVILEQLKDV